MTNVCAVASIKKEGDFCISQNGHEFSYVQFCQNFGTCSVKIHTAPADVLNSIWQWNGDYENPVIRPSIGCDVAPRCGKHITIGETK